MTEPTKFTVTRFDASGREVAATYTYGTEKKARDRFDTLAADRPNAALKITAWGAGHTLSIIASRNL
jgi:hypothetical protein